MRGNDDDIKIFHPKKQDGAGSEFTSLAGLMDKQRANGNSAKACFLGERLADLTPENLCPEDAKKLESNELMQLRTLIVFTAQISIHKYLPLQLLSTQAVNAMYQKLEREHPGFFANISDGSSFSFYYLSVRKENGVAAEIGKYYAMLCDRDNNAYLQELGARIFSETDSKVLTIIEEFEFEF